jgi:hypothetical protein
MALAVTLENSFPFYGAGVSAAAYTTPIARFCPASIMSGEATVNPLGTPPPPMAPTCKNSRRFRRLPPQVDAPFSTKNQTYVTHIICAKRESLANDIEIKQSRSSMATADNFSLLALFRAYELNSRKILKFSDSSRLTEGW